MTYETLSSIIELKGIVNLRYFREVTEELLQILDVESDSLDSVDKIDSLVSMFCSLNIFEGEEEDFHNLSVTFARADQYIFACRILEKGLTLYEYSVDLLADYLCYGMKCGKYAECEDVYKKLLKIKSNWNWRAYQFSIDYLIECRKSRPRMKTEPIKELVEEFVQNIPDKEESYLSKAEYLQTFEPTAKEESFVSVLSFATSGKCPVQRTPKCDLTLADYYYNTKKDLDAARKLINRCKRNSVEVQLSVNRNYVFLLSALCGISSFYDARTQKENDDPQTMNEVIEEDTPEWNNVMEIYRDFHIASAGRPDSKVRNCKDVIEAFIRETGVP